MGKHLDKSKVEQAFKQAASTLASGDKDARAGRFVVRDSDSGEFISKNKDRPSRKSNSSK